MVFNIAPRLPQLPGCKGEFTNPSYLFSRSPYWPHRINASKVSVSTCFHSTNVFRSDLHVATSMAGSMDSIAMFWWVSEWLHGAGMYLVSVLDFLCLIDTDALDLYLYRFNLDVIVSLSPSNKSNDSAGLFQIVSRWLCRAGAYPVSRFDFLRLAGLYRLDFDGNVSTPGANDPI